jgi:hypothetical protein
VRTVINAVLIASSALLAGCGGQQHAPPAPLPASATIAVPASSLAPVVAPSGTCQQLRAWKVTSLTAKVKFDAQLLSAGLPHGDTLAVEKAEATLTHDAGYAAARDLPPIDAGEYELSMVQFIDAATALAEGERALAGKYLHSAKSDLAQFIAATAEQCPA